eukprot:CAMPEP_0197239744 /NCGR_PEP_ID=MMETSP1429-20130617/6180_1 /TAXON_ID=49237 /ORGANISM="Chaetoceros  sp., Strain UNC1202" /LENGTH=452 /DNA_ID=CAMNT_0042699235 /DNA_START=11 /DNA_END=1369 /DNA_ORIENTATION=+
MRSQVSFLTTSFLLSQACQVECFQPSAPSSIKPRNSNININSNIHNSNIDQSCIRNNSKRRGLTYNSKILRAASKPNDEDHLFRNDGAKSTIKTDDDGNPFEAFVSSITNHNFFNEGDETRLRKRDLIRSLLRRLANLSLQDYSWRSDFLKRTEADRRVDESLARMMGEEAAYVRPMDAADDKIGPLGRAEKTLVEWLSLVIEEEGRRARLIASSDGDLVRPMDLKAGDGGPLASLENAAVSFLNSIRTSEKERIKTRTLRPKDVEEEKRGPLGNWEASVVGALDEIKWSEKLRMEQTRNRGGEMVRPIDVPGPLGEMEMWYLELITSEKQRVKDRESNDGKLVRPKDASIQGPLGTAERQFADAVNFIKEEETERLRSMQRVLEENRPMEKNRDGPLGVMEAIIVGAFRAPQMFFRVIDRVKELLDSEVLGEKDQVYLQDTESTKKDTDTR